jgi:hypothetical protein
MAKRGCSGVYAHQSGGKPKRAETPVPLLMRGFPLEQVRH